MSTLGVDGTPSVVERTLIRPPTSRVGPITDAERQRVRAASPIGTRYDTPVDRDSAAEVLERKATDASAVAEQVQEQGVERTLAEPRRTTSL